MWQADEISDPGEVAQIIKERALGKRRKGQKLGLVIEGGSMRGVVSAGAALALEHLELTHVFDKIYGVSAGAIAGAYFAAEQAVVGTSIFYDELLSRNFIDNTRLLRGKSPMNTGYLIEEVITKSKPLDFEKALEKDPAIFATRISDGETIRFPDAESTEDLKAQLKAAITIPFVGGGPVSYKGEKYLDAGIRTSVPWREALDDGCSHVLVLLSRPKNSPRPAMRRLEKIFLMNYVAREYPNLVPHYLRRVESYNSDIELLEKLDGEGKNVAIISPAEGDEVVSGEERDRMKLINGAKSGAKATYSRFFEIPPYFYEVLVPTTKSGTLLRKNPPHVRSLRLWR